MCRDFYKIYFAFFWQDLKWVLISTGIESHPVHPRILDISTWALLELQWCPRLSVIKTLCLRYWRITSRFKSRICFVIWLQLRRNNPFFFFFWNAGFSIKTVCLSQSYSNFKGFVIISKAWIETANRMWNVFSASLIPQGTKHICCFVLKYKRWWYKMKRKDNTKYIPHMFCTEYCQSIAGHNWM